MNGYSKTAGGFILALMVAVAFTGSPTEVIGIHSQCTDNTDNDSNGQIDAQDSNCWIYPFDDGGGEYTTTTGLTGKAWSSDSYTVNLFEWRLSQAILDPSLFSPSGDDHCSDTVGKESYYQQIGTDSGGKDDSLSSYQAWHPTNCAP